MNHADPMFDRICRRGEFHRVSVQPDLSAVGLVKPVKNLHERALAGTVLAQQRMDLTPSNIKVDIRIGNYAREAFVDSAHGKSRFSRGIHGMGLLSQGQSQSALRSPPQHNAFDGFYAWCRGGANPNVVNIAN